MTACLSACMYGPGTMLDPGLGFVGSSGYKASTHWTPVALVELDWFLALQNLLAEAR